MTGRELVHDVLIGVLYGVVIGIPVRLIIALASSSKMKTWLAERFYRISLRLNPQLRLHMEPDLARAVQYTIDQKVQAGLVAQATTLMIQHRKHIREIAQSQ